MDYVWEYIIYGTTDLQLHFIDDLRRESLFSVIIVMQLIHTPTRDQGNWRIIIARISSTYCHIYEITIPGSQVLPGFHLATKIWGGSVINEWAY